MRAAARRSSSARLLLAAIAAAILGATADADAAKVSRYGTSFVDADDDGVFDPGADVRLADILAPDDTDFDTGTSRPGYTPPPSPVGLVLEGKVTLVDWGDLTASGTLRVRGNVVSIPSEPDGYGSLSLFADTIDIAPRAKMSHKDGGTLYIVAADVIVGDRVRITTLADLWLAANGPMVIGDNVQLRSTGNKEDYEPSFWVLALDLQVGEGLYMRANDYADCLIEHNGDTSTDLVLREFRIRCGYIEIAAYDHPDGNRIRLYDSYLDSRTPDGRIRFFVEAGPSGYLPDPIVIENTSIRARGDVESTPPLP
jgi:hypothetical protein